MSLFASKQYFAYPTMPQVPSDLSWRLFSPILSKYAFIVDCISFICVSVPTIE